MVKIRWTLKAITQLEKVCGFIARESPDYAQKLVEIVQHRLKLLEKYPQMGRMVPKKNDPTIRELFIENHRLIYEIDDDTPDLLAFVHCSQDFQI